MANGWEVTLPDVAVIELVPGASPATRPVAFTLMTDVGDTVYAMLALGIVTPFTSRAIVVNCSISPTAIVRFGAVITTERIGALTGSLEHAVKQYRCCQKGCPSHEPSFSLPERLRPRSSPAVQRIGHVNRTLHLQKPAAPCHSRSSDSKCADSR